MAPTISMVHTGNFNKFIGILLMSVYLLFSSVLDAHQLIQAEQSIAKSNQAKCLLKWDNNKCEQHPLPPKLVDYCLEYKTCKVCYFNFRKPMFLFLYFW